MNTKIEYSKVLKEAQYILEFENDINYFELTTEGHNAVVLGQFYQAVDWLLSKGYLEYKEIESNTINPVQQNIFIPLRIYRVYKNGHFRIFKIYSRCLGGILITESSF